MPKLIYFIFLWVLVFFFGVFAPKKIFAVENSEDFESTEANTLQTDISKTDISKTENSQTENSQTDISQFKNILITIGYTDEHEHKSLRDLIFYEYRFSLSQAADFKVRQWLQLFDFVSDANHPNVFLNLSLKTQVTILNPNILCPGENPVSAERAIICREQRLKSESAMEYLNTHINQFTELIYIGHSRLGLGLGLGPFDPDNTFDFRFYNKIESGRLKKVVMASCDSKHYYQKKVSNNTNIEFIGTVGDKDLMSDLLPMVKDEIFSFSENLKN